MPKIEISIPGEFHLFVLSLSLLRSFCLRYVGRCFGIVFFVKEKVF